MAVGDDAGIFQEFSARGTPAKERPAPPCARRKPCACHARAVAAAGRAVDATQRLSGKGGAAGRWIGTLV